MGLHAVARSESLLGGAICSDLRQIPVNRSILGAEEKIFGSTWGLALTELNQILIIARFQPRTVV